MWLSVDPLAGKYPSLSPFMYCAGNPLNIFDPNGKDGVKIIDKQNKTITIKAIYYVETINQNHGWNTSYNPDEVIKMKMDINNQLNNANYKVSEGDYSGYSVKFDLEFKEGGSSLDMLLNPPSDNYEGVPITNTFSKGDDKTHPNLFKENDAGDGSIKVFGGVTDENKRIVMNSKYDTKRNKIHEIFHTLFFNEDNSKKGIGSYNRFDMPNQDDINKLINNEKLQKIEDKTE